MKKLKLDVDQIQVTTFRTEAAARTGGTVRALEATCNPPPSALPPCYSYEPFLCVPQQPGPDTESCC